MKLKEVKKLQQRVDEAGDQEDRRRALQSAVDLIDAGIQRLENELAALREVFRRKLETWLTNLFQVLIPFTIPEDHRDAKLYRIAAFACIFLEAALAVWICMRIGLPWWVGVAIAILAAFLFHGGLSFAFRRVERPKETIGRLRRYLVWPSIAVFGISFLVLLLARTATGGVAVLLLPLFGVALWTTTLGLLLLAGGLLAAAKVIDWSYKDHKNYDTKDRDLATLKVYKRNFIDELKRSAMQQQEPGATTFHPDKVSASSLLEKTISVLLLLTVGKSVV